jgi:phospholipid/cholesterol/gamma-HCH transport system substrate-binding protein
VRPALADTAAAARPLASTARSLEGAFAGLNRLLNVIAYDPPGSDQSVLFFLAWLGHNTNSLFLTQDANGPVARGLVLQSCQTAALAEGVASTRPFLRTLQQLTNVPTRAQIEANGGC